MLQARGFIPSADQKASGRAGYAKHMSVDEAGESKGTFFQNMFYTNFTPDNAIDLDPTNPRDTDHVPVQVRTGASQVQPHKVCDHFVLITFLPC